MEKSVSPNSSKGKLYRKARVWMGKGTSGPIKGWDPGWQEFPSRGRRGTAISKKVAMFSLGESENLLDAISVRKSQIRRAIQGQPGPSRLPPHTI